MTPDAAEALLVLRAQTGDTAALDELFQRVSPALERHLRRIVGHEAAAEDVLQDVLVIAWRKLRWLNEPTLIRPWLYRIATREAFHYLRRRSHMAWDPLAADGLEPSDPAWVSPDHTLLVSAATSAIAAVSPAARAVLSLHYLEGLTLDEAAAVLEIPRGTAKSRLAAGLAQLRRLLRSP